MSDPIEAAARAMWNEESRRAAGCDRRIQWRDEHPDVQDAWRGLARAAIEAYEAEAWRPIEEAPTKTEGCFVQPCLQGYVRWGKNDAPSEHVGPILYYERDKHWEFMEVDFDVFPRPTHFRLLPKPPNPKELMAQAIADYEAEQWVDPASCINDEAVEFLTDDGRLVIWESSEENTQKCAGWYDVADPVFGANPVFPKMLRAVPKPQKSEGGGR